MNVNPKERTEYIGIRVTPVEKRIVKSLASFFGVSMTVIVMYSIGNFLKCMRGEPIFAEFFEDVEE